MFPDAPLLLQVKQTHGVFARPAHDPGASFEVILEQLEAHERENYLRITERIPDRTLHDGAVVAVVCEITTKGEAVLAEAGMV